MAQWILYEKASCRGKSLQFDTLDSLSLDRVSDKLRSLERCSSSHVHACQVEAELLPEGKDNPWGNAFVKKETDLLNESTSGRLVDPMKSRFWKIRNPDCPPRVLWCALPSWRTLCSASIRLMSLEATSLDCILFQPGQ